MNNNVISEINNTTTSEEIAIYLATSLQTTYTKQGKEYEIKGQGGLYVNDDRNISKPADGKTAGNFGILGAFIFAETGKWRSNGKEFKDILQKTANYVGYTLPTNGNRPQKNKPAQRPINYNHPSEIYSYTDETGKELYQNCRYEGPKTFRQRQKNSQGEWNYTTKGLRKVPFHFKNLITEPEIHDTEGEKDVLSLELLGVKAVSFNIIPVDERKEFSEYCKSKPAFVYEDNDKEGRVKAQERARFFWKSGCSLVKIIQFDEMPEKSDVSDWIQQEPIQHDIFELYARIQKTPEFSPLEDITIKLFHVPNPRKTIIRIDSQIILPEGNIAGLTAPIGRGKSHFIEILAALSIDNECEPDSKIEIDLKEHEKCILIDTERTKDDCYYAMQRIWRRIEQNQQLLTSDKQEFRQLKVVSVRGIERIGRQERLLETMETPGLKLLLIDGALDFISNPNDIAQSSDFADWLFTKASQLNIAIFYTYHGNRNDSTGKGKGWLGAELQRLSTAFLKLDRHEHLPEVRVITTDFENAKVRHGRDTGINIAMTWEDELSAFRCIPFENGASSKPTTQELFYWCFVKSEKSSLLKSEIVSLYMEISKYAQKTAYRHIEKAVGDCLEINGSDGIARYVYSGNCQ